MAEAKTGDKRGPGRPAKSATPATKKQKLHASTSTPPTHTHTSSVQSPMTVTAVASPAPERKTVVRLPAKLNENKPLPSLAEPQSQTLSNDEYQSIAASAVLATSLEKSRSRWMSDGVLKRYWVKPEKGTGKNAKPPPPDNPDPKQMKMRGECRIRIEPHLFVANLYVVEKNLLPAKNKQPVVNQARQQQRPQQPTQQFQNRAPLPGHQPFSAHQQPLSPFQNTSRGPSTPQPGPSRSIPSPAPAPLSGQKASPDPVISMLATRASSDPELKSLMKEVATGNANQDQLKIFQKHIDELTTIIQQQKKTEEESSVKAQQQANMIQYDSPAESKPQLQPPPIQPLSQQNTPQRVHAFPTQQQSTPIYGQQQPWTAPVSAPAPTNLPVVLEFTGPGATEDRFLFPEYSILEGLSPQHLLVSFILTRKARDAVDTSGLDMDKEYWQPITIMIEVAYGREELLNCIRRWVKSPEEVRKNMQETMERCQRMPDTYLALRLPFKGTTVTESEDVSKEVTPAVEDKPKSKPAPKRKASAASTPKPVEAEKSQKEATSTSGSNDAALAATPQPAEASSTAGSKDAALTSTDAAPIESPAAPEGGRPRRAVRKSVRISEV